MKLILLTYIFIFLSACSQVPKQTNKPETKRAITQVDIPQSWSIQGRLALLSPEQNWHSSFSWTKKNKKTFIRFTGPLGQTFLSIKQTPIAGILHNTIIIDGEEYTSEGNLDDFISRFIEVDIPMQSLVYWIFGNAMPDLPFQITETILKNNSAYIQQLQQYAWQINFSKYTLKTKTNNWYPKKITAYKNDYQIKVFISQRQF